jgi:hypothetical protein
VKVVESMWMHDGRLERQRREGEGKSAEQQSSSASKEGVIDVVSTVDYFYHSRGGLNEE